MHALVKNIYRSTCTCRLKELLHVHVCISHVRQVQHCKGTITLDVFYVRAFNNTCSKREAHKPICTYLIKMSTIINTNNDKLVSQDIQISKDQILIPFCVLANSVYAPLSIGELSDENLSGHRISLFCGCWILVFTMP
jgi:hypothetical protein